MDQVLACLRSPDPVLQACAADVSVLTEGWLAGLRRDAGRAAEFFAALVAILLRVERQTCDGTAPSGRLRTRALSVPIQGLMLLCGGAGEAGGPVLPGRLAPGCLSALSSALARLLREAQDVPMQGFLELSLGAVCHLLCCLLGNEEGCAVAVATPGLGSAMIDAPSHCIHPHDRLCTTSPCRPLLQLAQRHRGVLLQCGALPVIFGILAREWRRPP